MPAAEIVLAAARGLHVLVISAAVGAFIIAIVSGAPGLQAKLRQFGRWLIFASLLLGLLWFVLQAGAVTQRAFPDAQWVMLRETSFGRVLTIRLGLIIAALVIPRHWAIVPLLGALALQPLLGHGAATEGLITASISAHVLVGGIWAGSLPWLFYALRNNPPAGLATARRFSPLGVVIVIFLGASIVGVWPLVGGVAGLFGSNFGRAILVKATLLFVMLACAGLNGVWFAPEGRLTALKTSIVVEALAGILVIVTAAWLALQPPGLHDQIVWPFQWQLVPGLWTDAFLMDRLWRMIIPVGLAIALVLGALVALRWSRLLALGLAAGAAASLWTMPIFPPAPFLRPALPTSFQTAETRRDTVSLQRGDLLFASACAGCHGLDAKGAGPEATGNPVWPPDLTASLFLSTRDGDWFWRIRHGMMSKETMSMPSFLNLSDTEIWRVIDYLRARASAESLDKSFRWQGPAAMPALQLKCGGENRSVDLSRRPDGGMVYWGKGQPPPDVKRLDPSECEPLPSDFLETLAILTGKPIHDPLLFAPEFLIDAQGNLRQIWASPPDEAGLADAVDWALKNPVTQTGPHH